MGTITVPGPSLFYLRWSCRRCGHTGGVARTTIPVDETFRGELMRTLLEGARRKIARVHQRGQGCIAAPGDFILEPFVPEGQERKGVL